MNDVSPLRRLVRAVEGHLVTSRLTAVMMGILLQIPPSRRVLNRAYEERSRRPLRKTLNAALHRAAVLRDFSWVCPVLDRTFLLPVSRKLPGSWIAAQVWAWQGNAPLRAFYELYLRHRPRGTFFDVGANFGIHSYPFAAHGYRCVTFEPQPVCVEYIRQVSALNRFSDFHIEPCAVGDDQTGLRFFISSGTWQSGFERAHVERFALVDEMLVDSMSLDTYFSRHEIQPTLVKIDVETWEWHVLRGGSGLIESAHPDLVVEVFPDAPHRADMWRLLDRAGYRALALGPDPAKRGRALAKLSEFLDAEEENFVFTIESELAARCEAELADPGGQVRSSR